MKSGPDIEKNGDWRRALGQSFRRPEDLLGFLGLDPKHSPAPLALQQDFPMRVPRGFAERMGRGDWNDPLLRQVLPWQSENEEHPGFVSDPVEEGCAETAPGLLRKYRGRSLLVLTGTCAVHCRYCFRREYPYAGGPASKESWMGIYDHLARDSEMEEIIFSGGDPLSLSDDKLQWHAERALALPRLRRLRLHTRLPVVLPERVDEPFRKMLAAWSDLKPVYLVLHANHARELDSSVADAVRSLRKTGVILLNQAVLLRGVNDSIDALVELCLRLTDLGVLPYYLHQLDRVRGSRHFEVPEEEGLALMAGLKSHVPGYAVPRYVREIPGQPSKTDVILEIPESHPLPW